VKKKTIFLVINNIFTNRLVTSSKGKGTPNTNNPLNVMIELEILIEKNH
jgi:hypothetical protein